MANESNRGRSPRRREPRGPHRRRTQNRHGARERSTPTDARRPRRTDRERDAPSLHLSDDVVRELHATARPGKGDILVKVFAEAGAAFAAEDYDEAIRLGEQAKHIALRSATVRELLGLAYYRSGRWNEAARELSAFRRIAGTTEQNPVLADSYRAMGKPGKAIEYVDEIERDRVAPQVFYEGAIVAA